MASVPQSYEFRQSFPLCQFTRSTDLLITEMFKHLDARTQSQRHHSVFPTLIGIEIDFEGQDPNTIVRSLRVFLQNLRKIHQQHFVRFVTDTLWVMESNSSDIFYGDDGDKHLHCDAVWTVKVTNPIRNHFDVKLTLPSNFERADLLADLSRGMKKFLPKSIAPFDDDHVMELVGQFYTKTQRLYQASYLKEPLHILLLPSRSGSGFYPIALYGMSYADGRRRQSRVLMQNEAQHLNHRDFFPHETSAEDLLYTLLNSIQDNDNFGVIQRTIKEIYGLSELVFAYWSANKSSGDTHHDIILFNITDRESQSFETIRFGMQYLSEEY